MPGDIFPYSISHEFTVLNQLGSDGGGFNQGIAIVERKKDGKILVRKTFRDTGNPHVHPSDWMREMKLLRKLHHPNISKFINASITPDIGRLYMEFCDFGNLSDFKNNMNQLQRPVPESFAWHVLKSLIKALCFLHLGFKTSEEFMNTRRPEAPGWECVLHRDIKSSNIFLKSSPVPGSYPQVKMGDFGLAIGIDELHAQTEQEGNRYQLCRAGTPDWVPPEFPHCGARSDIFCIAAVVQYICKHGPWRKVNPEGGVSRGYSHSLDEIIRWCMQRDRCGRPYAKELARAIYVRHQRVNPPYTPVPIQAYARLL